MTVGEGYNLGREIIGWDGDHTNIDGDALTDADFMYENETYKILVESYKPAASASSMFVLMAISSGSIDDAAVRKVMTLYIDGAGFPLKDADYGTTNAMAITF